MEHNVRQCLIASRLGDRIGLDDSEREGLFYAGIMAWVGCHVDAYEQAKWFGDEAALKGDSRRVDFTTARAGMAFTFGHVAVGRPLLHRARAGIERVRMHPYLTERALASSPGLARLGDLAIQHHERLDGSGYPRGVKGDAISASGRVLAAADVYRARIEPRPHRPAAGPSDAGQLLRSEVRAGPLDGDAAEAVLRAAGHRPRRRRDAVAGLTAREIEVLRLLARGCSNKQIANELKISRKTTGNRIEHIYTKLGVTNRALASLFAVQHGLID